MTSWAPRQYVAGVAQEQIDIARLAYKAFGDYVEIEGLGDVALYAASMATAIKDGLILQVAAFNMDKDRAIELAKLAMARL